MTDKSENKIKTLKDVIFFYTSVSYPNKQLNKDNKPPLSDDPLELHSYEVKVLIPDSRYKGLKKAFKGAKNFPNAKEYTPEECVTVLKMDEAPVEDMVLIKFSQGCLYGPKGNRKPTNKITQIGICGKVQDRNGVHIDGDTKIGNGTKGLLQFKPVENEFGLYLYPTAICITEHVEYASGDSIDEEGFGIEELKEVDSEEIDSEQDENFSGDDVPF